MTINEAIQIVIKKTGKPLTAKEVYQGIISDKLYSFNTPTPEHIVLTAMRRKCEGLDFKSAHKEKFYKQVSPDKYDLL